MGEIGKRIIVCLCCSVLFFGIGCRQSDRGNQQYDNISRLTYRVRETNNVELTLRDGKAVVIQFGSKSAKVINAYLYEDEQSIFEIIQFIRGYASEQGLKIERGNSELYGEYRLHTILYSMEYKLSQTKDADLDYVADRRWYVNVCSKIIGWCGI